MMRRNENKFELRTGRRRGYMLLEMIVAAAIMGVLLTVSLQLLTALGVQRRDAQRRLAAAVEVGNLLERIAARPWDEITSEKVAGEKISDAVRGRLPGAELKIDVKTTKEPNAKRICVSLAWRDRGGQQLPPVQVATWRWKEN
jgi:prepilin-type N-terminal cleavage/methylation domain-containing protein